ncbi:hypothetical protein [Nesterenkonia sp.]|uniref:hypothetical protein n=1 Tax=Nesterenkonia sp. TaxID=704201 RepID=UPI00261C5CF9|nr:hypothetical protein [Nesterenkonia sp.]
MTVNVQMLVDLPDDEFEQCVSQAIKGRRDFPDWWRLLLHEDLIDATEGVIEGFLEVGLRQARDPERYPHARGFAQKMRGILAEITLERAVREEG